MWLLWILSLAAAASFLLPATGEVLDSFTPCKKFFLDGNPPKLKPRKSARICQLYENRYRFATMYDKDRRIPTFSAYIYQPGQGQRRDEWKIEPQLALPKDREYRRHKSMELEETSGIDPIILANSQAVEQDYRNADPYDRGHLAPALHQPDQASKDATFTLTNILAVCNDHLRKSMELEDTCGIDCNILATSQAVDWDYKQGALLYMTEDTWRQPYINRIRRAKMQPSP
ncbi:endonuclease domain-containing 1 protein-like [Crotalus adamanteus]|uniref:Endonuclease domain-containing 1 protein-like n=1 Tax=Crotalus adamanteus TaxID=8729 RepID=A0AAW1BES4_CROAD